MRGYNNFEGIDASSGMIEKCRAKGHYKSLKVMYLGGGDLPEEMHNAYDAVVCSGSFLPGHLPSQAMEQMV